LTNYFTGVLDPPNTFNIVLALLLTAALIFYSTKTAYS